MITEYTITRARTGRLYFALVSTDAGYCPQSPVFFLNPDGTPITDLDVATQLIENQIKIHEWNAAPCTLFDAERVTWTPLGALGSE